MVITVGVVSIAGAVSIVGVQQRGPIWKGGYRPPAVSYQACFNGYSGFEVTPLGNPPNERVGASVWTFKLPVGSEGYMSFEYNVTRGLDPFLGNLSHWMEGITYANDTSLWADISGSTVVSVRYNSVVPGEPPRFPIQMPTDSFPLGVQLSAKNYTVKGNSVDVTWSLRGLRTGGWWVISNDFDNRYIMVVPSTQVLNISSRTFSGSWLECYGANVDGTIIP